MVSYLDNVFLMNVLWSLWQVNKKYEFTKPLHDQQPILVPCQYIKTVDAQKVVHCALVKFVIVEERVVSATSQADVSKLPLYDG